MALKKTFSSFGVHLPAYLTDVADELIESLDVKSRGALLEGGVEFLHAEFFPLLQAALVRSTKSTKKQMIAVCLRTKTRKKLNEMTEILGVNDTFLLRLGFFLEIFALLKQKSVPFQKTIKPPSVYVVCQQCGKKTKPFQQLPICRRCWKDLTIMFQVEWRERYYQKQAEKVSAQIYQGLFHTNNHLNNFEGPVISNPPFFNENNE